MNRPFQGVVPAADIGGSTDRFRFVYQTLSGDGSITARVAGTSLVQESRPLRRPADPREGRPRHPPLRFH